MGNYGRWDRYVDYADPYGTNGKIDAINQIRAYREGQAAAQRARPSITDINEARRQALYDQDTANELKMKQEMADRNESPYEQDLDRRGLLFTNIDYETPGDDGRLHPATLKIRGKADPATAALAKEAAAQGLIGGNSPWTNTAENRAALAKLIADKKDEALQQQSRQDALDKDARAREDAGARAQIPVQLQAAQFQHDVEMAKLNQQAKADDPDRQSARRLQAIQEQIAEEDLKRRRDEYLTPQQEAAQRQAAALASLARAGDIGAYHALRILTADPKLGINADIYKPDAAKVFAQPEIQQKLAEIDAFVKQNNWNLSPAERAVVLGKAKEILDAADEFGPQVKNMLQSHISQILSGTGSLFETHGADALRAGLEGL